MEAYNNFLASMEQSNVPTQGTEEWFQWRQVQYGLSGSEISALGGIPSQMMRIFGPKLKSNIKALAHGIMIEPLNCLLLQHFLNCPIVPAKTIVREYSSSTSDGYCFLGGHGWSVEIKSPFSSWPLGFTIGHILQIYWNLQHCPPIIRGSIYHAHVWSPISRIGNHTVHAWAIVRSDAPICANMPVTEQDILAHVGRGGKVSFPVFFFTTTGVTCMLEHQKRLIPSTQSQPGCFVGYICNEPPPIFDPQRDIIYGWLGGFSGIFERQTMDAVYGKISYRVKEARQMAVQMQLTAMQMYDMVMGRNFLNN